MELLYTFPHAVSHADGKNTASTLLFGWSVDPQLGGPMRVARFALSVSISFLLSFSLAAHQTNTSKPQAQQLLQQSLNALSGGQTLSDVTLSGTARRIAGSDDETGTATYKAISGANRLDLSLSGGARSETANSTATPPAGSWSGPNGASHPMAFHNLTNQAGISPAFTLAALTPAQNFVMVLVGQETKNGHSVYHLSASQQFPQMAAKTATLEQHLTQMDIFLDASTLLPVALDFSTHPDNDAGVDIPVELLFSDYRAVAGAQVPFHIQKFFNNSLLLDLLFTNAQLNSGLSATLFNVQ